MATNEDILAGLAKLEKSSRLAIPLSLFAFLAIMGMLYFSGRELQHTRQQIDAAKKELAQVVAETQDRLQSVDRKIEQATANKGKPEWAVNLQSAREDIAVADAKLTGTKMQATAPPKTSATGSRTGYGATSVDIFYCETSGEAAKQVATRIATLKGNNPGRWRVRVLAATVNASEGYGISSNVVRYNPDETGVAKALMEDVRELTGLNLRPQEIPYPTPNYISAFMCQPAQAAATATLAQSPKPAQAKPVETAQPEKPAKPEGSTDKESGFTFTFGFGGGSKGGGSYKSAE